ASIGGTLLFRLARDTSGSARVGWIAALLYAMSPYLIRQSAAFMEVTLAVVLLIAAALQVRRADRRAGAVVFGALLAAIVLTRFSFLPIAVGGVAVAAARAGRSRATVAAAVGAALVAPWMA